MRYLASFVSVIALLFVLTGCSQKIEQKPEISKANLQKADWEDVEGFQTDNHKLALNVFKKDCKASIKFDKLRNVCKKAYDLNSTQSAKEFFQKNFTPYKLIADDEKDTGIITGYYEPMLNGSKFKTNRYKYPLYAVPEDLVTIDLSKAYPDLKNYTLRGKVVGNKVVPYETREEINAIDPRTSKTLKPICYVDSKIDLFFLHIQGSGKVKFPNGKIYNIAYGQQNGRKYYSIGRELIKAGAMTKDNASLQSIKKWLNENPELADELMNMNQSYIFFKLSRKSATGSLGTQLVAKRNLAVDRRYIPLGYPVFINTKNPITKKPINSLMVAADTGGAIKGKIRADFFFGHGSDAENEAGKMKEQGKLYMLVPNDIMNKKEK